MPYTDVHGQGDDEGLTGDVLTNLGVLRLKNLQGGVMQHKRDGTEVPVALVLGEVSKPLYHNPDIEPEWAYDGFGAEYRTLLGGFHRGGRRLRTWTGPATRDGGPL